MQPEILEHYEDLLRDCETQEEWSHLREEWRRAVMETLDERGISYIASFGADFKKPFSKRWLPAWRQLPDDVLRALCVRFSVEIEDRRWFDHLPQAEGMLAAYESGRGLVPISEHYGVGVAKVKSILTKAGALIRQPGACGVNTTAQRNRDIVAMSAGGASLREIARHFGLSHQSIALIVRTARKKAESSK